MALLADDVATFSATGTGDPVRMRASAADTYFRGALAFYSSGRIVATAPADAEFAGVVVERTVIAAQDEFVWLYVRGLFLFGNTAFTIANQGALFYALAASDNPADLTTTALGNTAAVGRLIQAKTTAVDGWIEMAAFSKIASAT